MAKANLRKLETQIVDRLPVKEVRRGKKHTDFAITCFADEVWKLITGRFDLEVRGPWFAPTNKARKSVDAILYRISVRVS